MNEQQLNEQWAVAYRQLSAQFQQQQQQLLETQRLLAKAQEQVAQMQAEIQEWQGYGQGWKRAHGDLAKAIQSSLDRFGPAGVKSAQQARARASSAPPSAPPSAAGPPAASPAGPPAASPAEHMLPIVPRTMFATPAGSGASSMQVTPLSSVHSSPAGQIRFDAEGRPLPADQQSERARGAARAHQNFTEWLESSGRGTIRRSSA
jgi:hypothetical protein